MKKLFFLIALLITFISCDEFVDALVENAIRKSENTNTNFDTFLDFENTSNFQLTNIELYFQPNNTYTISQINPQETTNIHLGFYSITDAPQLSFYINNQYYEVVSTNSNNRYEEGNYLLRISNINTISSSFTYELINVAD